VSSDEYSVDCISEVRFVRDETCSYRPSGWPCLDHTPVYGISITCHKYYSCNMYTLIRSKLF